MAGGMMAGSYLKSETRSVAEVQTEESLVMHTLESSVFETTENVGTVYSYDYSEPIYYMDMKLVSDNGVKETVDIRYGVDSHLITSIGIEINLNKDYGYTLETAEEVVKEASFPAFSKIEYEDFEHSVGVYISMHDLKNPERLKEMKESQFLDAPDELAGTAMDAYACIDELQKEGIIILLTNDPNYKAD